MQDRIPLRGLERHRRIWGFGVQFENFSAHDHVIIISAVSAFATPAGAVWACRRWWEALPARILVSRLTGKTAGPAHPLSVPRLGEGVEGRTWTIRYRGQMVHVDEVLWHRGVYEAEVQEVSIPAPVGARELIHLSRREDDRLKRKG